MAIKDNYEGLEVTIDTREKDSVEAQKKNKTRMKIVTDFFESLGCCVERKKVEWCDYAIRGNFYRNDKLYEVNHGCQYKTLNGDFFPSLPTLPEVLFRAHSEFTTVSIVVEENGHELRMNDDLTDGMFQNYSMQAGCDKTGTGLYSAYKNFMQSMAECKIQARSIRTSDHFPIELVSILKYITKPTHDGLCLRPQNFQEEMLNVMCKFPGVGVITAEKLLSYIPNLYNLCDLRDDELQLIIGPLKGKQLYSFLHNTSRKELCAANYLQLTESSMKKLPKIIEEKPKPKPIHDASEPPQLDYLEGLITPLRFKGIEEFIRVMKKGCTMEDIKKAVGWSEEAIFMELMKLKGEGKIWKNEKTRLWEYGHDKNETPVKADLEMEVGV